MQSSKNDIIKILKTIINDFKLPVTKIGLAQTQQNLPENPALSDITDILKEWKIETIAIKIKPEQLIDISFPAIALVNNNGYAGFILLRKLSNNTVTYYDPNNGIQKANLSDFSKIWNGITLLFEPGNQSGEINYKENSKIDFANKTKRHFLRFSIGLILSYALYLGFHNSIHTGIFLLCSALGLGISTLLIMEEMGSKNPVSQKICNINKKTSCKNVLSSPVSQLFPWLSLADIGLIYFTGGTLSLLYALFSEGGTQILLPLIIINSVALTFTIFSIYYQGFVIKQWCVLCLIVQFILLTEFVTGISYIQQHPVFLIEQVNYWLIIPSFLLPLALWPITKPHLTGSSLIDSLIRENNVFKKNTEVFQTFLKNERPISPVSFPFDIILGNPEANLTITMISSPTCTPCNLAYDKVKRLLENYNEDFKLTIRFFIKNNTDEDNYKFVNALLAINIMKKNVSHAIERWYELKDYSKWSKEFVTKEIETMDMSEAIKQHLDWISYANINLTPFFIINEKILPKQYQIEDLKYHISHLNKMEFQLN
jgi:uncharacterized membrane protein